MPVCAHYRSAVRQLLAAPTLMYGLRGADRQQSAVPPLVVEATCIIQHTPCVIREKKKNQMLLLLTRRGVPSSRAHTLTYTHKTHEEQSASERSGHLVIVNRKILFAGGLS